MESGCKEHKLVADIAIFAEDRVLMVKYKDVSGYDGQRGWFLPDDYLERPEHPEEAARRIAREQAQIKTPEVRLSHIESFEGGAWHLIFHYAATLGQIPRTTPGGNVAAMEWFDLSKLPGPSTVAHGGWALDVLERIRSFQPQPK